MQKTEEISRPIGVFDSGVGGVSTLRKLHEMLPNEDFLFYGDSKNAPYGSKSQEDVYLLSKDIVEYFKQKDVKAIVIACNTATSAAKERLTKEYPELPIIGIEPALKEAVDNNEQTILVMGTKLTMKLPKYQKMVNEYSDARHIISLPSPGLAEYIESGMHDDETLKGLLQNLLASYANVPFDGVVLGCTHYPFVAEAIQSCFRSNIAIHTGYEGVANRLKKLLAELGLSSNRRDEGSVSFDSSSHDSIQYYEKMFQTR